MTSEKKKTVAKALTHFWRAGQTVLKLSSLQFFRNDREETPLLIVLVFSKLENLCWAEQAGAINCCVLAIGTAKLLTS